MKKTLVATVRHETAGQENKVRVVVTSDMTVQEFCQQALRAAKHFGVGGVVQVEDCDVADDICILDCLSDSDKIFVIVQDQKTPSQFRNQPQIQQQQMQIQYRQQPQQQQHQQQQQQQQQQYRHYPQQSQRQFQPPARQQQRQQPSSDVSDVVNGMGHLWRENLESSRTSTPEQHREEVRRRQEQAKRINSSFQNASGQTVDQSKMGTPDSNAGWVDLLTEASLLPKPQLRHVQHGGSSHHLAGANQQQQQVVAQRGGRGQVAGGGRGGGLAGGRGEGLAQALENPMVQNWLKNNPNAIGQVIERNVQNSNDPQRKARFEALAREPEQRWMQCEWMDDPALVKKLAMEQRKPIICEVVVGRYAEESNAAAC